MATEHNSNQQSNDYSISQILSKFPVLIIDSVKKCISQSLPHWCNHFSALRITEKCFLEQLWYFDSWIFFRICCGLHHTPLVHFCKFFELGQNQQNLTKLVATLALIVFCKSVKTLALSSGWMLKMHNMNNMIKFNDSYNIIPTIKAVPIGWFFNQRGFMVKF